MAVFTLADLHLSFSTNKPMDVFGVRWHSYMEKLDKMWRSVVKEDDTVVIPGDICCCQPGQVSKHDSKDNRCEQRLNDRPERSQDRLFIKRCKILLDKQEY